ncbi:TraR/DksA family transcriptional regulator [Rubrobacter marinus]|uniref:TraR/DksA family transcriptional regulator n=2 Tax=Rubrobacter marinus TaxID=2653852 RepID=A0A6G8Q2M6_9ACTN|nr:TraR/DksA family transcriptional regulator [Rubrobacter marinus]
MRSARSDAGFLSRQRYRLEEARDLLRRELGGAFREEGARQNLSDGSACAHAGGAMLWLETRLRRRLGAVERALEKIEEGTYGICDVTGEFITLQRLEAVPEATCAPEARRRRGAGL